MPIEGSSEAEKPAEHPATVAAAVAAVLAGRGLERVYALPGGHVKPIWDELDRRGVRIVSVRHEGAAVHMAQADSDLSSELAVAIVTTGPGFTNAVTGIAAAYLARSSILVISAVPPRPQLGMGALEEIDQARMAEPVTRLATTVRDPRHVLPTLDRAIAAALGDDGPPGPAYVDFPADLLREAVPAPYGGVALALSPRARHVLAPEPAALASAVDLIGDGRRPLVVAGAEVKRYPEELRRFLDLTGAVFLDTRASRGALEPGVAGSVPGMRVRAMAEADLVITLGRVVDFELGFGSPVVYSAAARFLRVGRSFDEFALNRRGDVEIRADVGLTLAALIDAGAAPGELDSGWRDAIVRANAAKADRLAGTIAAAEADSEGRMHPYSLIGAINEQIDEETIVIVDGGDILSHSRAALKAPTYLDLGPFGCLGLGVPFANAAALAFPDRPVVALVGDGAFGFHALELETAVREGARTVIVIANNSAWNIERQDQVDNYGGRVVGTELTVSSYAELARALGAHGEAVDDPSELDAAIERAFANPPAVIDVTVSREPASADSRSGLAKVPPLQAIEPWNDAEELARFRTKRKEDPMAVVTHEVEGRERPRGYSDVATAGPIVAVAGQLPGDDVLGGDGGLVAQFGSAMRRFREALAAVGTGADDILMLRIYVTDIEAYKAGLKDLGPVFRETFDNQYPPTTLVEVSGLVDDRALVEIEGLAAKPSA